jgi:hypothetical protein
MIQAAGKRRSRMLKLREAGIPDAEIGRRFGVSRARIGQLLGAKRSGK